MSIESNIKETELTREAYWLRYPQTSPMKLRWRASAVKHCFHVLPGESILELGDGSGLWTECITEALSGKNPITAEVFNQELLERNRARVLMNVTTTLVRNLSDFAPESFDYVIATAILCHDENESKLKALQRLLKPGGQILFFEANHWNPQVFVKNAIPLLGRWRGQASCQAAMRRAKSRPCGSQAAERSRTRAA